MSVVKRLLLTVLSVCFVSGVLLAQDEADLWKLSATVSGEGTDNRDSTPDGESNFDLFLRMQLDMNMDWESSMIDFFYAPAYRYRTDPSALQNDTEFQHNLGLIAKRDLGNINLKLNERFNYTDDPSIQQDGSTLRRDSTYMINNIGAGVKVLMGETSDAEISVRNMIKRYDDNARALESDESSTGAELSIWRRMEHTLSGYIMAGTSVFDYDTTAADRGFSSIYGGVGVEKSFSRDIKGGLRLGYTSLSFDDASIPDDTSPFINCSIASKMTAVSRITGTVGYVLRDSDVYPFSSQEATSLSVKWDWKTTPLLGVGALVQYRLGSYDADTVPDSISMGTAIMDGDETTVVLEGEVKYNLNEETSIKLVQRWEDVDSDVTGSDSSTRNSTRVSLSKQF